MILQYVYNTDIQYFFWGIATYTALDRVENNSDITDRFRKSQPPSFWSPLNWSLQVINYNISPF